MSKYFKIDRNSREIIIDKHKSYNVNVDILDLIIDLQLERDKYKNIINTFEEEIEIELTFEDNDGLLEHNTFITIHDTLEKVLKRIKELKEGKE